MQDPTCIPAPYAPYIFPYLEGHTNAHRTHPAYHCAHREGPNEANRGHVGEVLEENGSWVLRVLGEEGDGVLCVDIDEIEGRSTEKEGSAPSGALRGLHLAPTSPLGLQPFLRRHSVDGRKGEVGSGAKTQLFVVFPFPLSPRVRPSPSSVFSRHHGSAFECSY